MSERNYEMIPSDVAVPIKAWTRGVPVEEEAAKHPLVMARASSSLTLEGPRQRHRRRRHHPPLSVPAARPARPVECPLCHPTPPTGSSRS